MKSVPNAHGQNREIKMGMTRRNDIAFDHSFQWSNFAINLGDNVFGLPPVHRLVMHLNPWMFDWVAFVKVPIN
jgi:hypothetical protein